MMMVLKRKEILVSALIVLIGAAALVNYNYSKNEAEEARIEQVSTEIAEQGETYSVSELEGETIGNENSENDVVMMGEAKQVSAQTSEEIDYFSQAKLNRESARSKKIDILNQVIENQNTDEQTKQSAQQDLLEVAGFTDIEAVCENLIIAKGFEKAVCFINDNSVTVTVKAEKLSDEDAAKIQEIVAGNTGISTKYIKIVAV